MSLYDLNGNLLTASLFVNVKDFGAVGDGLTDDTTAIQTAIDSIKNTGGTVFFPFGTYKITTGLYFYSNQILDFNYSTLLQGSSIDNLLMTYCEREWGNYDGTHDCVIKNATFDGGSYTTPNTLVGTVHAKNIIIENCTFVNAYGHWHNLEINSTLNCKVVDCKFEGRRKTTANGCLIQIDAYSNDATWPWANGAVDGTTAKDILITDCRFYDSSIAPAIGNHSATPSENIRINNCWFDNMQSERGAIRISASNVEVHDNTFTGCTVVAVSIRQNSGTVSKTLESTVHDNKFIDCTTISEGATAYNNMLNGTLIN